MRKGEYRVFLGLEDKETARFAVLVLFNKLFLQISPVQTKDNDYPSHEPLSHSKGSPQSLNCSLGVPLDKLHTLCLAKIITNYTKEGCLSNCPKTAKISYVTEPFCQFVAQPSPNPLYSGSKTAFLH